MMYAPVHKRKTMGKPIHETLSEKKDKAQNEEKELEKIDSSFSKNRKEIEKEKVESEYLIPEVKNWIETDSVKAMKGRVKNWLKKSFRASRQICGMLSVAKRRRIDGPSYKKEHEERDKMSRIYKMLTDLNYSGISIVMLAERMSIAETERDLISLLDYGFPVKEIIVNQVFPKSNDKFLKSRYSIQRKNIASIKKRFSNLKIREIPYFESEVIGIEELERISKILF